MQVRPMIVIDVLLPTHHGSWFLAVEKLFPWRQALICLLLICCDLKMKKIIFFFNSDISIESTRNFFIDSIEFKWFLRSLSFRWYRVSDSVWKGRGGYEHDLSSTDILNHVTWHRLKGSWGKIFWKLRWIPWNHMWS